ncbi:hypothetical protein DPEC_G00312750 [Dallia pectoralis]|uniref:Uncharacterized protein n=1 Tax=Dallia pectoralis TaxID=75939 RepID=A0ACC2FBN8_DALPE|nr:hypothetical protein DPEC_G00312750 [Dallia pectoralis]
MEEEDGTCLLDVLCDPQALNDFLHGTNELQNEDLLIACSSGEPSSLFTDTPSPVSLLADDITSSEDTPPAGCMDLAFLDEALLCSPEVGKGDMEEEAEQEQEPQQEEEEEEVACDILQQSLQEADITEHTMALEAGLIQPGPGDGHAQSLYTPVPTLLPPPAAVPFLSKPLAFPQPQPAPPSLPPMPRDTQAAVEPPQPSLLAVGPGCPSLKPAITQLMGLLPGNVFPAPTPEASFSLTPAQTSSTSFSLIQKAVPSLTGLTGHPLLTPAIRAAAAPGIYLQRGPLPIQPKLPISIQPRLVQISPKPPGPPGQNTSPGLTFLPGTPSSNILLSSPPLCSKTLPQSPTQPAPQHTSAHLPKPQPLSLQLVNQGGGSFLIQPQGLFHGQNQFLLSSQSPVTLSQLPGSAARPLFTPGRQGATVQSVQGVSPSPSHHLLDGSQILTAVPHHRQLNFSPHTVFTTTTTPSGQLSLRPGTLLSGSLQLQTGPPTVFQVPAQLAGAYAPQRPQGPGGPGRPQHATLLHSPALGNHIALMHSSGMQLASSLPDSHMTSISILNAPPAVVQTLPFTPQTTRPLVATADGQISVQQASVVLLPDRAGLGEKRDDSPHLIQPSTAELQGASPVLTLLEALQALDPPGTLPKHLLDPSGSQPEHLQKPTETRSGVVEIHSTATHNQSQDFIHQLQEQSPTPPSPSQWPEVLAGTVAQSGEDPDICPSMVLASPLHPETEEANLPGQSPTLQCPSPSGLGIGSTPQSEQCLGTTPKQDSFSSPLSKYDQGPQAHSQYDQGPQAHSQYNQGPQAHREHDQWLRAVQTAQQIRVKVAGPVAVEREQRFTQAMRRHRFHQQLWQDQEMIQDPQTFTSFSSVEEAVTQLLPYHTCAGHLPGPEHFNTVDEQFDSVSGFLLKRTNDMLNRYRQLLLGEALQVMPSAEMVMLDRLFLQSERFSLAEDRKMAHRDPESFLMALRASESTNAESSCVGMDLSSSPPSHPAWSRLSDRPPGLRTYCSSSRGDLRLTIKHQSGSRKVIHNSACDTMQHTAPSAHKRDYTGQMTNGGGVQNEQKLQGSSHRTSCLAIGEMSIEAQPSKIVDVPHVDHDNSRTTEVPTQTAVLDSQYGCTPNTLTAPSLERQNACIEQPSPDQEMSAPKLKRYRPMPQEDRPRRRPEPPDFTSKAGGSASPDLLSKPGYRLEACPSATPPHLGDNALSEHLQSAINSILELQRLQGPAAASQPRIQGACQTTGPTSALDQTLTSILQGRI